MKATTFWRSMFSLLVCLAVLIGALPISEAMAASTTIVISQVYGGGGNSGATYKNDFIELYNLGSEAVDVTGWSVQYTSATGTGTWYVTNLTGIIQAGKYYLVKEAAGAGGTVDLPSPDATGTIAMAAGSGKVALVASSTALTGGCPTGLVDQVGYGPTASCYETAPTAVLSNTTAALRKNNGAQDTDNNLDDFVTTGPPQPRNSVYPFAATGLATPNTVLPTETSLLTITITPAGDSTGITASADLSPIGGSSTQVFYDDATHGDATAGDNIFSFSAVVTFATPPGLKLLLATASDAQARTVQTNISLTVSTAVITPIADARTAGAGWVGTIQGNVTVVPGKFAARSFAIQDATGGMYVYPSTNPPTLNLGDLVKVQGTISVYHGLQELTSITNVAVMGTGTPPEPLSTATGSVAATQGMLIQIEGTVASFSGTTNKTVKIDDGTGETTVYIYSMAGLNTTGIAPGIRMRFIGMSGAYDTPQVNPRYQSDVLIFPQVTGTYPVDGALNASLYRPVTATFNHGVSSATVNASSFLLVDKEGPIIGAVGYDAGTSTAIFTPTAILTENTLYTATLTSAVKDIFDLALTPEYTWTFTSGVVDKLAPVIVGQSPAPDAIDVPLNETVIITFSEELNQATLVPAALQLTGPSGDVPYSLSYDPTTLEVTLSPESDFLPASDYDVTVLSTITDWAGNPLSGDQTWTFTTMAEPAMQAYLGDLHNHTSYSDGAGTPAQALAAGKAAGFDFMAISDHSYAIDDSEWADTLVAVNSATTADFLALRGFEYTQGAEGHINVYNTVRHAVRTNTGCSSCDYTPNLEPGSSVQGFYQWAASTGTIGLDEAGTVLQFNHPGWINFNDWTYHPEVSAIARLEEVGNGNGSSYTFSEDQFIRSLDYGWKVGATNNADTHTTYWGVNTEARTGVWMAELTKDALLDALRQRRTYATEDKNFSLMMKANGQWMGSEIPNTGQVKFEITGSDPDGELASLVQVITDQGVVAQQVTPETASFSWSPEISVTGGVHYFYVKVTQADGQRIVSSPVWTQGTEDLAVTDLVIEPSIPTVYNASLLTVRVTNRAGASRTVTVAMDVNGTPILPSVEVTVPANGDAFANFSWQPLATGSATITAQITGAPADDNPDDNQRALVLEVTDEQVPLILIDAGKGNLNATGNEMSMFIDDLSAHNYNVLKNLDTLTAADLDPAVVKLLFITAPESAYSEAELAAIGNYVKAGGNLWLSGVSDYPPGSWAATAAGRENAILTAIESATNAVINMRFNDDEIIDGNDNNGYPFGVAWGSFPSASTTGIGMNVEAITSWSVASLVNRTLSGPLTATTPGIQIVVQGDLETGSSLYKGTPYANHTSNTDADEGNDAYIYNPDWLSPWNELPANAIPVPMAAATDLGSQGGRILLYGDSNDAFTTFAYTAGDGKQNELFNLEAVLWLTGEPLTKSTIAEARAQAIDDQPDNLNKLVWVEGEITAAYGEFFNVLYVQDATGGITVHAPAGDIDPSAYTRGTKVRVVGTVDIYNGDTEIQFFEAEMVQVIEPSTGEPSALPMSTHQASLEESQGWLAVITGTVSSKVGEDTIFVNDGTGVVRVFLDGYNGDFSDIQVYGRVRVTGLVSEDGEGGRIRVRNHGMHSGVPDDVWYLGGAIFYLPIIGKS